MPKRLDSAKSTVRIFWRNIGFAISSNWQVSKVLLLSKLVLYVLQGIFPLITAFLAGRLIDNIVKYLNGSLASTRPVFTILILGAVVGFAYNETMRLSRYLERRASILYESFITISLMNKFAELDHTYYEDASFHKELNKVHYNLNMILRFSDESFYMLSSSVQLLVTGMALVKLNPLIAVILIIGIIPLLKVQMVISKDRLNFWNLVDQEYRLRNNIRSMFLDTRAIGEIKIFQLVRYFTDLWKRFYDRNTDTRLKMERKFEIKQLWAGIAELITELGIDVWLLLKVLAKGAFTLGQFEFYRRLVNDFSNASSRLVYDMQTVSETGLYLKDYLDLMDNKPKVMEITSPKPVVKAAVPKIEFKNVSFHYPNSTHMVLKNLNMVVEPGEDIALVGENGAGKSTIVKLLMRFYDVTDGQILINGEDIKNIKLSQWYQHVGALFQDFNYYQFFKAKRVIGVGDVKHVKNMEKIKEAAKEAGADKFISRLPDGYDTVLSKYFTDGTDLSGGEWQRVALARAFFRNANVLILDEPTAAIDAKAEYEIFQKIAKTQAKKTTIIISHRFSTVRNAHKIFVIEHGQIIEQGSHEDLMKIDNGLYQHMFNLQAEGYR